MYIAPPDHPAVLVLNILFSPLKVPDLKNTPPP
jgi:hypothetical protein